MSDPHPIWPRDAEPSYVPFPAKFTAHTEVHRISDALGVETLNVNALWFAEGARSKPHRHDVEQLLYYTEGTGVVAVDGGPDVLVETGQFVRLPAGTVHVHGAAPGCTAAHLSLMPREHTTDFDCPVPAAWRDGDAT